MTTELIIDTETADKKDVKVLHESIFWDEDDPRWHFLGKEAEIKKKSPVMDGITQVVDLSKDSYIWAFSGSRGAGKTISMTYYAAKAVYLYGMRIISNYPIAFFLNKDGKTTYHEAEPLDMYKLLCFDKNYRRCLIIIDEAPDVISHMASMTWKNRLLNIFVRQLRKNNNSLFMGCQQLGLIDKSMRWQTDLVVKCQDAFRLYGGSQGLERGALVLLDIYDNSGQWTGEGMNADWDEQLNYVPADDSLELPGKPIWGIFDTFYQQDVFESLKRVDMKLDAYHIGEPEPESDYRARAWDVCSMVEGKVSSPSLFEAMGELTEKEKQRLALWLKQCKVKTSTNGKIKDFNDFDRNKFQRLLSKE